VEVRHRLIGQTWRHWLRRVFGDWGLVVASSQMCPMWSHQLWR
jgi:hypothetical protein